MCSTEDYSRIRSLLFFCISSFFSPLYLYKSDYGRKIKNTDHGKWEVETSSFSSGANLLLAVRNH